MTDKPKCHHKMGRNFHAVQCSRAAVVDGKWCRQHDPEAVKRRREDGGRRFTDRKERA